MYAARLADEEASTPGLIVLARSFARDLLRGADHSENVSQDLSQKSDFAKHSFIIYHVSVRPAVTRGSSLC